MGLFRRSKLSLGVQVEESWAFSATGNEKVVARLFAEWLQTVQEDGEELEVDKPKFKVGFNKMEDLGTSESNIQLSPSAIELDGEHDEE